MSGMREAPQVQAEIDPTEDRGRRWYHLRPKPRRRNDLWGFQLGMVDGAGMAAPDRPGAFSVAVVVT